MTVDLGGGVKTVRRVQVSATCSPSTYPGADPVTLQNRFTALRQFEIWACNGPSTPAHRELLAADRVHPDLHEPGTTRSPVGRRGCSLRSCCSATSASATSCGTTAVEATARPTSSSSC